MPAPSLRGRFVWHELMTTDPDAAARFYPAVTGWKVQTWEHNPAYRLWTMGGAPMAGLMALPDHSRRMGTPPAWLSYVGVPDVDATVRQATSLGARTYAGPQDIPVGRFAVLADPQGATFGLYKPSQQPVRGNDAAIRSEEHTSELQSQSNLVCRLLLEKKKSGSTVCITPYPC